MDYWNFDDEEFNINSYKEAGLQLRSVFKTDELAAIFYHVISLSEEEVTRFKLSSGIASSLADTGRHGPTRKNVCRLCGQPLPRKKGKP
jgi:hypothetical protein